MHGFWKNWMTVWCYATITLGVALAGMAFPASDGLGRAFYGLVDGGVLVADAFDAPGLRFSIALLGAVTIGWGLTIMGAVRTSQPGSAMWRWLTAAIATWYVIDSALSVATGFPLNALSNTAFIVTYLVPVLGSGVLSEAPRTAATA